MYVYCFVGVCKVCPVQFSCLPCLGVQIDRLYNYLSHNMAAIDFYLNYCVFPEETSQVRHSMALHHTADVHCA